MLWFRYLQVYLLPIQMNEMDKRFEELQLNGKLPSPKGVALELLRVTQQDDVSISRVEKVIQLDPALTGQILKLANSAAATRRRPLVSVADAVQHLGLVTVRQIALGFSLLSDYQRGKCHGFDYGKFWSHSLAMGIAGATIARQVDMVAPEECFTLGLLANIGSLALATAYPDEYAALLSSVGTDDAGELRRAEKARFAINHAELTRAMLTDWGIPISFVAALYRHKEPNSPPLDEGSRSAQIAWMLDLANQIGLVCIAEDIQRIGLLPEMFELGEQEGIDKTTLSELTQTIVGQWQEWGKILRVQTYSLPPLASLERASRLTSIESGTVGLQPLHALVVDDTNTMLEMISVVLKDLGHSVRTARDGQEGLDMAIENMPQLLIVDWEMPGLNGIELCRALRATDAGRYVYVMVLTGLSNADLLDEAFAAGADDYLTKPLNLRELAARVRASQRFIELQQHLKRDAEEIRELASELSVVNRRLQEAAMTDVLTGLANRRHAMDRLSQEFTAAKRGNEALSVMIVDIDHFKAINDIHGHDAGDEALRQLAAVFRASVRGEDEVFRFGGEEFLVISRRANVEKAVSVAERLRHAVEKRSFVLGGTIRQITISIGVATYVPKYRGVADLLKAADVALYEAKRTGRNRTKATAT